MDIAPDFPGEHEHYFLGLLDALPVAIYITDAAGTITWCNQAAEHFVGRRPEIGRDAWCIAWQLFRPDGTPLPHQESPVALTLREGRPVRGQEIILARPDGTRVHAMPYPSPLFDRTGRLVGAVNLLADITDKKRSEAMAQQLKALLETRAQRGARMLTDATGKLKESEQTFRLLVQNVTDYAIFMLDPNGYVANWNPGAERIKGYTRDEIVGQHFSRFYTKEDQLAGVPAQALDTAGREGRFEQESWRVRKDGSRFWANIVIDAMHDNGELIGFAKVTRDLTERRLVEEKLRHSQKMDALGQLTGGIAHDFNNLLTVVVGNLEVLGRSVARSAPPNARVTRAITAAMEGAQRGAALTKRLLAFSRQQELQAKPIDPIHLIHRTADMLRHTLGERISIATTLAPDTGRIHADPVELENALLNLAVNARDAMPEGGRVVIETASIDRIPAPGAQDDNAGAGYVLIAVSDGGIGMDADVVSKAFDPFFTTKEAGRGTGLGLSQVYGFVRQSAGHVRIYSEPGHGTTVKIYLPRHQGAGEHAPRAERLPDAARASGRETILVVEDDEALRAFAVEALGELGYRVLQAADAQIALDTLDREPEVDLLFTDVVMPGGRNGRQLADEAVKRRPTLKVLFTTGYTRNAIIHHGRLDPGVNLIGKPYTFEELGTRVRTLLDGKTG